jgi:hypothetical protein
VIAHIVAILLAITLLATWAARNTITGDRWAAARFVLLSPITAVLLITIGLYDPFTVLGVTAGLWAWTHGNKFLLLLAGIYLGFQHFEQGLLVLAIWSLAFVSLREQLPERLMKLRLPLLFLPGLVMGKIILMIALVLQGLPALQGRSSVFSNYLLTALNAGAGNFPAYVWFSFAGLWLLVIISFLRMTETKSRILMISAIALAVLFSLVTVDTIRVTVIITLPLALLLIVARRTNTGSRELVPAPVTEGVMWLATPTPMQPWLIDRLYQGYLDMRALFLLR